MINKKYSFKDFTGQSLIKEDPKEFTGSIKGSCFYHEALTEVFPDDIECTFERCNLDNVIVPAGCTISIGCTNKRVEIQNDCEAWILDDDGKPVEPVSKARFIKLGISIDPKYIPSCKQEESITFLTETLVKAVDEEEELIDGTYK